MLVEGRLEVEAWRRGFSSNDNRRKSVSFRQFKGSLWFLSRNATWMRFPSCPRLYLIPKIIHLAIEPKLDL
jgi:hypothetical protein